MKGKNGEPHRTQRLILLALCTPIATLVLAMAFSRSIPLEQVVLDRILIGYCLALLAFLSGVRMGAMLVEGPKNNTSLWLVVGAPVLAIIVVALPFTFGVAVLIVAFGALGAWDSWSGFKGNLERQYAASRHLMTWLISALLLAILVLHGLMNA